MPVLKSVHNASSSSRRKLPNYNLSQPTNKNRNAHCQYSYVCMLCICTIDFRLTSVKESFTDWMSFLTPNQQRQSTERGGSDQCFGIMIQNSFSNVALKIPKRKLRITSLENAMQLIGPDVPISQSLTLLEK